MSYVVLLTVLFSFNSFAATTQIKVSTEKIGVFNCTNATVLAENDLQQQCKAEGLVLDTFIIESCYQVGDDGGYVEYFSVVANGLCVPK